MRIRTLLYICLSSVLGIIYLTCVLPEAPPGPEEAGVSLCLKSSTGTTSIETVTDSVGKIVSIGLVLKLTQYIDSTVVTVTVGGVQEFREKSTSKRLETDTVIYPKTFSTPGERVVTAVGYISGMPNSEATAIIKIVGKPQENHPPSLSVKGAQLVGVGETVLLHVSATDPDAGQTALVTYLRIPNGATFKSDTLRWVPTLQNVGTDTAIFVATDNGYPVMTFTDTVLIAVSATPVNHAPEISVGGRHVVTAGETMVLAVAVTDPDAGQTPIIEALRKPATATFSENTFLWATTAANIGTDTVIFVATDNGDPVLTDTEKVVLTVSETLVNNPPGWNTDTLRLTGQPGTLLTRQLGGLCSDPDGDAAVFTLLPGAPEGAVVADAVLSFTPAATATGVNTMQIVAADPFGGSDTLVVVVTVSSGTDDLIKPVMYRISPSSDSQTVSSASYQVAVSCTDASGIA
ncbi:MAG: hypothetical protein JW863_18815, partial [Chitinispirillaceae bacterium]|nr:hypothetical protein [Chitinispirillaceae bacterium]